MGHAAYSEDHYKHSFKKLLNQSFVNTSEILRILDLVPVGISIALNVSCREIRHNPKAAKFLRIPDWESFSYSSLVDPPVKIFREGQELKAADMPIQRAAWCGEYVENEELEFVWNDGVRKFALWSACPIYNANGDIMGAIAASEDISDRKCKEEKVKRREKRLREYLDKMPINTTLFSALRSDSGEIVDFVCEFINDFACKACGQTREKLIGKRIREIWPDISETEFYDYCEIMKSGETLTDEQFFYEDDAKSHLVGVYTRQAVRWGDGIAISIQNITERRKAEKEIEQHLKKMQAQADLLDLAHDYIIVRDMDSNVVFWNQAAEKGYGWSQDEAIGKNSYRLLKAQFSEPYYVVNKKLFETGKWQGTVIHTTRTGEKIIVKSSQSLKIGENGQAIAILEINRDITEQEKIEKELMRLGRLDLVGEMAASIGHEVRNPMTTVRGFLQMFSRKEEFVRYREQIHTMIEEMDRANSIISEFLSLAKDKLVTLTQGDINELLTSMFPLLQADAFRTGHQIDMDMSDIPAILMDEKEIRQLLLNLVRNAIESMQEAGEITIKTYQSDGRVVMSVQDSGPGIPENVLDKIGIPFVTTKENGFGLGLPICFRIAQRHMATVAIDTSSKGTTFKVQFPASNVSL